MRADRPIRLPLQVGTSALYSLARGSAFAVPGIILFAIGLAFLIYAGAEGADLSGDGAAYLIAAVLSPGFVTSAFAYKHLRRAIVQRPSDLVVTDDGLEIRGGRTTARSLYLAAALFMLVAWPVAVTMMVSAYRAHELSIPRAGFLVGFVLACIMGFYALIRGRLVDRQALRLMAVNFAAIEPATPGLPYRCLRCLAPLSATDADRVLVRCAYCSADNVLGLHIGREASIARDESASLEEALARRHRERRRWRGVTVVAIVLLTVAWLSLRLALSQ